MHNCLWVGCLAIEHGASISYDFDQEGIFGANIFVPKNESRRCTFAFELIGILNREGKSMIWTNWTTGREDGIELFCTIKGFGKPCLGQTIKLKRKSSISGRPFIEFFLRAATWV